MGEGLTRAAARNIFYGGSIFFLVVFVALVLHSHWYASTKSIDVAGLNEAVARGKHVWERNSCINCHTLLGEGAYFAPELGNVWVRYGGRDDPEAARAALKAWIELDADRHPGPPADAALRADRPGARRPRQLPGVGQQDRHARLAAQRGWLGSRKGNNGMLRYPSQGVAYWYFVCAMALFLAQVLFGVLAGTVYVFENFLAETVPFHILRMIHTNALIVWLLLGFFGATYYLLPEEVERDIYSTKLAYVQLVIFVAAAAVAVVGYLFRIHEGREFLEQPLYVKIALTVAVLMFLFNITMTLLRGRKTAVASVLFLGLWGAGVFFLFAFYNPANLVLDKMYWWWVVHIWVEGVWELIMAAILAYLLIKVTGVDREVIEKWLYIIVGLSLFSGLLGTGHHYFWIGTPGILAVDWEHLQHAGNPAVLRHGDLGLLPGLSWRT